MLEGKRAEQVLGIPCVYCDLPCICWSHNRYHSFAVPISVTVASSTECLAKTLPARTICNTPSSPNHGTLVGLVPGVAPPLDVQAPGPSSITV